MARTSLPVLYQTPCPPGAAITGSGGRTRTNFTLQIAGMAVNQRLQCWRFGSCSSLVFAASAAGALGRQRPCSVGLIHWTMGRRRWGWLRAAIRDMAATIPYPANLDALLTQPAPGAGPAAGARQPGQAAGAI